MFDLALTVLMGVAQSLSRFPPAPARALISLSDVYLARQALGRVRQAQKV